MSGLKKCFCFRCGNCVNGEGVKGYFSGPVYLIFNAVVDFRTSHM